MSRRLQQVAVLAAGLAAILSFAGNGQCQNKAGNTYLDRNLPGGAARLFAPGVVSRPRGEGAYSERPVFSPDFRECYFDVNNYKTRTFTSFVVRYRGGEWTAPEPAFFAKYGGVQASLSSDGQRLFFAAPSPRDAKIAGIWMAKREGEGWAAPGFLDLAVNAGSDARFPCVTRSGTLYFLYAVKDARPRQAGVCRAKAENGSYRTAEKLAGLQASADLLLGDFYVAPDESYIVIYSDLPDKLGLGDLYVSFRRANDTWSDLRNLGPAVNTRGYNYAPSISPDGRFLFFTRDRGDKEGDVYWIGSEVVDKLRPPVQ